PGVKSRHIVHIVGDLLPGIKDSFLVCVIRIQRGNDTLDGIVEQNRTDTNLFPELKMMIHAKERLVLTNGFAFVIEDGPATADPARRTNDIIDLLRLGLNLFLDFTPKPI